MHTRVSSRCVCVCHPVVWTSVCSIARPHPICKPSGRSHGHGQLIAELIGGSPCNTLAMFSVLIRPFLLPYSTHAAGKRMLVSPYYKIVSIGWNRFPSSCSHVRRPCPASSQRGVVGRSDSLLDATLQERRVSSSALREIPDPPPIRLSVDSWLLLLTYSTG